MAAISQDDYLKDTSQFDRARSVAQQQSAANLQNRQDALKRRFASLGNLDSGVALKLQDQASNEEASNLNNANEGINAAQNAELSRRREVIQGQKFATSEREGGQKYGAEQSALQRAWGSGEREAGQKFVGEQSAMQRAWGTGEREAAQTYGTGEREAAQLYATGERGEAQKYATGEREAGQSYASGEADKQRAVQQAQFDKQYGLANDQFTASKDQFEKTFALETKATQANMDLQKKLADEKGLFEGIGAGGTNIVKGVKGGLGEIGKGGGSLISGIANIPGSIVKSIGGLF